MTKKIILFLLSLLFISCSSLPENRNGKDGLVMFIASAESIAPQELVFAYEILFDGNKTIRIDPSKKYAITKKIEPGEHILNSLRIYSKGNFFDLVNEFDLSGTFIVEENKITLFPLKLVVTLQKKQNIHFYGEDLVPLTSDDINKAKKYFYRQKYSDQWEFLAVPVKSKKNPEVSI